MKLTIGGKMSLPKMRMVQIHSDIIQGTYGGIGTKYHTTMGIRPDANLQFKYSLRGKPATGSEPSFGQPSGLA